MDHPDESYKDISKAKMSYTVTPNPYTNFNRHRNTNVIQLRDTEPAQSIWLHLDFGQELRRAVSLLLAATR